MISKLQILWAIMAAVSCSFLQTPSNQFQSTFNSTFLTGNERLFKPIFIPNITNNSETPHKTKVRIYETQKTNENEVVLKKILQPQEISQESTIRENYLEDTKTTGNPLKFSSRYSTKDEELTKEIKKKEKLGEVENPSRTTDAPDLLTKSELKIISSKSEETPSEKSKSFSDRSDELEDSTEEQTDSYRSSDSDEQKDEEPGEVPSATDETYSELPSSNSFRKYSDFENYETASVEATDNLEENEKEQEEGKRSVNDYYNSGSKNYHSIQTPLKEIKYRGPHSFKDDFESEKVRTRFSPIRRRPVTHNWPQIKSELEKLNEISDSDESYEKTLDEGVKEEVKIKPEQKDLELAVEKDEFKFDRNKKYNFIEKRNRMKQQQKNLAAEENKDDKTPLFQSLQQYQVDEKEPNYQPEVKDKQEDISKFNTNEKSWTTRRPHKNIFDVRIPKRKQPKNFNISDELSHNFQGHRFLGPIVFNQNLKQETVKTDIKSQKEPVRNIFLKGLSENEKVDQGNLSNQKFQKSIFGTGSLEIKSFNHLDESDEMYNAILANIQSVFGLRTHLGKSGSTSQKGSIPKVNSDETKSLTWSLPPIKREKVN